MTSHHRNKSLEKLVDTLGAIKARIANCEKDEADIVKKLKDRGCRVYTGLLFEANVFEQGRTDIDWEAIAKELTGHIPPRVIKKHTKEQKIIVCKVTARNYK